MIKDDHCKLHKMTLHNVLYVPSSPVNLFSPQRFAKDSCSKDRITGSCLITSGEYSFFRWVPYAVMIEDTPDDASEGPVPIKPLLNDVIVQSDDPLSEVEEDVLDIKDYDMNETQLIDAALDEMFNDNDIPQMDRNDLERLKDAIRTPLGPSQTKFLQ